MPTDSSSESSKDVIVNVAGVAAGSSVGTATADVRYSFTAQFLRGAFIFTARAEEIERAGPFSEDSISEHRSLVAAAVMQSSAALEAEISEVAVYGPGHHLGSDRINGAARDFLQPLAEIIDKQSTPDRYELVLHLMGKEKFDRGVQPFQDAALLVRLRNELVHYKSRLGRDNDSKRLFISLEQLGHKPPPFVNAASNFFPHKCLSADSARWAAKTAVGFIDGFYRKIDIPSPLDGCRAYFV